MTLDRPGFADPAANAQSCFRAVLEAMSRPGTIASAGAGLLPPAPLDPATAAVLLTLVDADTPLWLDPAAAAAWDWTAFHCGATRAGSIGMAAFACALTMPALSSLHPGTDLAPEESATLILQVPALGRGTPYCLSGPGLRAPALLHLDGLPGDFAAQWAANHALYPCGVDVVLCAGDRLCALPRSVRIEEG
jgi:alpha-D-ribose 1-methylphosphonate 5-triphosphate synthase subunit PhnH